MPILPSNIDATFPDSPGDPSVVQHQKEHDQLHRLVNGVGLRPNGMKPDETSKYAHVQRRHGSIQAAVADLVNANGTGDGTIADVGAAFNQATLNNNFRDLSDKVNALAAVLRATGIMAP